MCRPVKQLRAVFYPLLFESVYRVHFMGICLICLSTCAERSRYLTKIHFNCITTKYNMLKVRDWFFHLIFVLHSYIIRAFEFFFNINAFSCYSAPNDLVGFVEISGPNEFAVEFIPNHLYSACRKMWRLLSRAFENAFNSYRFMYTLPVGKSADNILIALANLLFSIIIFPIQTRPFALHIKQIPPLRARIHIE